MKIRLEGTGALKEYMGDSIHEIELHNNAVIADLYPEINTRWGTALPPHIWNPEKEQFRGAVVVVINKTPTRDIGLRLNHGDHVQLVKALTGG